MADYLKVQLEMTHSENADYSDPEWRSKWDAVALTPDEVRAMKIEIDTSAVSLDFTDFATVTLFAVQNTNATNFVTVTWTDSAANANTQKVQPGRILVIPDIAPATNPTLTADTAAVVCKLAIAGT